MPSSLQQEQQKPDRHHLKSIVDDNSLTFAEKAITIKDVEMNNRKFMAGDIVVVSVDLAMAQDSTGPLAIRSLSEMGIDKLHDPSKTLLVIDHTFPAADEKVANLHAMIRDFVSKHNCLLVEGSISHQYILEYLADSGMMILGADSHTCQAGCLSAFASGIGSTEIAAVWASGQLWLRVPETIMINISGAFNKGVFARDLILDYIGKVGEDGANYRALEWKFSNDYVKKQFSIDSRACISNASMECGAKVSVFPIDEITRNFLDQNPRINNTEKIEIQSGSSAKFKDEFEIECNKIEAQVSGPDNIDKVQLRNWEM